jgi:glycosyltransferase involved in cell wall biosynthesis
MQTTKVLFFIPHLVGGGAERVTINIIKQLDKKLFDITLVVLSKDGPAYKFLPKDLKVIELNSSKTMFSILKLRRTIKAINPDVVFSSIFRGHIALYFSLLGVQKKPRVILRSPNSPKLILERKELSFHIKKLLDIVYKNADKIIAQTPEMKDEIIKYHFIGEKKIEVFLNPIDKELIDEKIKNIDNPFDSSKINVVAAGRLTVQKGFDILIKSFEKIVLSNSQYILHIIGDDQGELKKLKILVDTLSLSNNVFFLGYQDNSYRYFFYSDLYVLSSRWEGLPNTVLENLYLKKPIVSTMCIPFMSTLIKDGENGFLVDVENTEQLSNAILNYKNISNLGNILNLETNVNNIFLDANSRNKGKLID